MNTPSDTFHRYIRWTAMTALLACTAVFAVNATIDPLWYFGGNQLNGENRPFNEREAKINLLLQSPQDYDCIIFGSSRTTLMPADAFAPHRCFNLAFSSGQIEEFIAYADYLKHLDIHPSLIVVGVDGFNFMVDGRDPLSIPAFVVAKRAPDVVLASYLSIDTLKMSWDAQSPKPVPRYYDAGFNGVVHRNAPRFDPAHLDRAEGQQRGDAEARRSIPYAPKRAALYAKLVATFPDARFLAYVPPISAWHIDDMARRNVLGGYLDSLHATAQLFPRMIDFSIPGTQTASTGNTYDGSHYTQALNRDMGRSLLDPASPGWGIDVTGLSRDVYQSRYRRALLAFRDSQMPGAAATPH